MKEILPEFIAAWLALTRERRGFDTSKQTVSANYDSSNWPGGGLPYETDGDARRLA